MIFRPSSSSLRNQNFSPKYQNVQSDSICQYVAGRVIFFLFQASLLRPIKQKHLSFWKYWEGRKLSAFLPDPSQRRGGLISLPDWGRVTDFVWLSPPGFSYVSPVCLQARLVLCPLWQPDGVGCYPALGKTCSLGWVWGKPAVWDGCLTVTSGTSHGF